MGSFALERELIKKNYRFICGIDEAGRGSLAGPVIAAACILDPENIPYGIKDSKKLTPDKRQEFFNIIRRTALDWSVGIINNREIDRINILEATIRAMIKAVENLSLQPDIMLIDALELADLKIKQKSYIRGDENIISISAASIIAKVRRDEIMQDYHKVFPQYNWIANKGYPTREHYRTLEKYGPSKFHRVTFKGVSH
jgi:ribonuclease HII